MDLKKKLRDVNEARKLRLAKACIRAKKITPAELVEMSWDEKLKWNMVKLWDAFNSARRHINSRTPKWKRILKGIYGIARPILYILAAIASKKLPI